MSSPIAIPRATKSGASAAPQGRVDDSDMWQSVTSRSLPTVTCTRGSGVYVPVHRRGASASSLPESGALSARRLAAPAPPTRTRSVSPSSTNRYDPLASANIPPATIIPNTTTTTQSRIYSLTELLGLASSPAIGLSPSQRSIVDSHIPLMMSRVRSSAPRASKKTSAATATDVTVPVADAAPDAPQKKTDVPSPRRRRTGRKPSSAKARVPAAVGADVEGRRRRGARAYGAGWGWSAAAAEQVVGQRVDFGRIPVQGETWRAERVVAAAA
ncbi:hypothetical protein C8Q73DRAFT_839265 [Cubamyces lactineus]|nr:hypothetical protein C8Q73DRAFT_839265 [Cubamyces lactineus]